MTLSSVRDIAMDLPIPERVALLDHLWDSIELELNWASQKQILQRWASESEDRVDALDRGDLKLIDGPTALSELRSLLPK